MEWLREKGVKNANIFPKDDNIDRKKSMAMVIKHANWIKRTPNRIWSLKQKKSSDKWLEAVLKCQS